MPPPAPDPTIQTSYVFRCGNGAAEERPKIIADPRLRTRESTLDQGKTLGAPSVIFVSQYGGFNPAQKPRVLARKNVTYEVGKPSFYRAKYPRPTGFARAHAIHK